MSTAFQLTCPPIPVVRIALIGLGQRGMKTLERYAYIEGAEIRCVVDWDLRKVERADAQLRQSGRPPARMLAGQHAWLEACRLPDIDLVYICTDWLSHTPIALEAMRNGKHTAVEVPAATSVDECWQLVRMAERTQRHCFMTENCCYDLFALETLDLCREGRLGDITHCEGGYIHDLASYQPTKTCKDADSTTGGTWIERACIERVGNPYPTHGIGPIAQLLGFHRTDRMEYIVSVSSIAQSPSGKPVNLLNSSLIQTVKGVSILLQLDVSTPRPYSRLQVVCGTCGFVQKYPTPILQLAGGEAIIGDAVLEAMKDFTHSAACKLWHEGKAKGVPNAMNYAMDARLIHCLQNGLPLDIDVYDAAEWSSLAELSRLSAEQGGVPIPVPDFTGERNR